MWRVGRSRYFAGNGERGNVGSCVVPVMGAKKLDRLVWERLRSRLSMPDIVRAEFERYRADDQTAADVAGGTPRQGEDERQLEMEALLEQ